MQSITQRHKAEMMYEYYEIHQLEEVMLTNTRHHMTEMKDEQAEIQEIEGEAVNNTSSQNIHLTSNILTCTVSKIIPIN